ncbi:WhiB family transcriptional regulator [Pseudonocardia acidicola]|uniref:Transcriptional regulator WhiB n=1 Tax=Pseudonocardia acidicola TaxID=2724939 RepID=A0ABX1SE00_9PSEU|nr:WhiB family transcriptional regulator [Pseudonocardia acidicola]NMH99804.1 WhiB family transcriptional regulator [Pseudonocardia acidicola]
MTEWIDRAACRQFDAELFFPVGSGAPAKRQTARAKAVCACCQVTAECLDFALRNGEVDGVWGGLDAEERRALRNGRPAGAKSADEVASVGPIPHGGGAATVG